MRHSAALRPCGQLPSLTQPSRDSPSLTKHRPTRRLAALHSLRPRFAPFLRRFVPALLAHYALQGSTHSGRPAVATGTPRPGPPVAAPPCRPAALRSGSTLLRLRSIPPASGRRHAPAAHHRHYPFVFFHVVKVRTIRVFFYIFLAFFFLLCVSFYSFVRIFVQSQGKGPACCLTPHTYRSCSPIFSLQS